VLAVAATAVWALGTQASVAALFFHVLVLVITVLLARGIVAEIRPV
jgi:hypothetical protein